MFSKTFIAAVLASASAVQQNTPSGACTKFNATAPFLTTNIVNGTSQDTQDAVGNGFNVVLVDADFTFACETGAANCSLAADGVHAKGAVSASDAFHYVLKVPLDRLEAGLMAANSSCVEGVNATADAIVAFTQDRQLDGVDVQVSSCTPFMRELAYQLNTRGAMWVSFTSDLTYADDLVACVGDAAMADCYSAVHVEAFSAPQWAAKQVTPTVDEFCTSLDQDLCGAATTCCQWGGDACGSLDTVLGADLIATHDYCIPATMEIHHEQFCEHTSLLGDMDACQSAHGCCHWNPDEGQCFSSFQQLPIADVHTCYLPPNAEVFCELGAPAYGEDACNKHSSCCHWDPLDKACFSSHGEANIGTLGMCPSTGGAAKFEDWVNATVTGATATVPVAVDTETGAAVFSEEPVQVDAESLHFGVAEACLAARRRTLRGLTAAQTTDCVFGSTPAEFRAAVQALDHLVFGFAADNATASFVTAVNAL